MLSLMEDYFVGRGKAAREGYSEHVGSDQVDVLAGEQWEEETFRMGIVVGYLTE